MKTNTPIILCVIELLFVVATFTSTARGQGGVPLWTNRFNFDDRGLVALDSSDNVFATGSSIGSGGAHDYAVIKYSGSGVPLWTNHYHGPGDINDFVSAIAVDNIGEVFVTGAAWNNSGIPAWTTIAYSGVGAPLWTNRYQGANMDAGDKPSALAVDSSGNVLVTGTSGDPVTGAFDCATIKYSGAGGPLWTNIYPGTGGDCLPTAVAVDHSENVFVTGKENYLGSGDWDYTTIKYSAAGVPVWTNRYGGSANGTDSAVAIATDSSDNVFVAGDSYNNGYSDYATIKYSGSGAPLWTNRYDGPANGHDLVQGLALDKSGDVIVIGQSEGRQGLGYWDYATIKYSAAGIPLWTNRYNSPSDRDDYACSVAVDGSGNVFVTGYSVVYSGFFATLDASTTICYSAAGVPLWTNSVRFGTNNISGSSLAVDSHNNVIATDPYSTIKFSASPPASLPLRLERFNNQLVLNWNNASFSLQSAPNLNAAFTNVPSATSPFTNSLTAPQQFFRLKAN